MNNRYLQTSVLQDLNEHKMVFLGGPRQVGKTTFAQNILKKISPFSGPLEEHPGYLNWDSALGRKRILKFDFPKEEKLLIFDEIHKFPRWRNYLKGLYDTTKTSKQYIVTGSARLDYYRKGGDSLIGRYHYYRLHPLSLGELSSPAGLIDRLLKYGGFPEPFLKQDEVFLRRWQNERFSRIIQEDLRDLERVREIHFIDLLLEILLSKVGAPLSIKNIREEMEVAHQSVENWIQILERLYVVFRIPPFGAPKIRAVKKEQKLYFWDWSVLEDPGIRFENMVACQLLKYCHFIEDTQGFKMELRFIRDVDLREIDFVVLKNKKPLFAVECKNGEKSASTAHSYFRQRTNIEKFYQVHLGTKKWGNASENVEILPFSKFVELEQMP